MLFSGHKNICNEQKEGGNGSRGTAIKGMVFVGIWIGSQKGAINCNSVPFNWGKGPFPLDRSCSISSSLKGRHGDFPFSAYIYSNFIGPNKSAPPRINREGTVSDTYLIISN